MKRFFFVKNLILILIILFAGCKKENKITYDKDATACGVKNPIENLAWLSEQFDSELTENVTLYEIDAVQVIEIKNLLYSSQESRRQYTCDGKMLEFVSQALYDNYIKNRKLITIIFPYKNN